MSASALTERPPRLFGDPPEKLGHPGARRPTGRPAGARRPVESSDGGRLTLGRRLDGVWEGLLAGGAVECPLCLGRMALPARGLSARCADCGSSLH